MAAWDTLPVSRHGKRTLPAARGFEHGADDPPIASSSGLSETIPFCSTAVSLENAKLAIRLVGATPQESPLGGSTSSPHCV
jgi:hypothetical protein